MSCNIVIYPDDTTTLYSKFDQASDLWQHIEFSLELELDLPYTVGLPYTGIEKVFHIGYLGSNRHTALGGSGWEVFLRIFS